MSMTRAFAPARGLSLVELMIGIAVGLFIVAAAGFMLTNQLHDGRRLMLETQLQQDLRAAADMVARELRRAGYSPAAADAAWFRGTTGVVQSGYASIDAASSEEVRFGYGLNDGRADRGVDNAVAAGEQFGFRRNNGAIEFQLGQGNWQQLTDPTTLQIDTFSITENVASIDLNRFCARPCVTTSPVACGPRQLVREYDVDIRGHAVSDPSVQRSLRVAVRPRNDAVSGSCS